VTGDAETRHAHDIHENSTILASENREQIQDWVKTGENSASLIANWLGESTKSIEEPIEATMMNEVKRDDQQIGKGNIKKQGKII
jgi:hypothetical protein